MVAAEDASEPDALLSGYGGGEIIHHFLDQTKPLVRDWECYKIDIQVLKRRGRIKDARSTDGLVMVQDRSPITSKSGWRVLLQSSGNKMANGAMFDAEAMNAAMLHVPLGTKVSVTLS